MAIKSLPAIILICACLVPVELHAQRGRQMPPSEDEAYGSKFFDQLRKIFGIFRDADLQRAFQTAQPIQCSELIVGKGEWRTVAFYNEDRSLGEWCRENIDEVRTDLSVYTFKGPCTGDQAAIQVATEFPVGESINAYNEGKIELTQVDVTANAPVSVVFDSRTQAYRFELPYLFRVGRRSSGTIYSLAAPTTRDSYATDVSSRWECKAVRSNDVTYRFLICRTATVPRREAGRNQSRDLAFGASAYFILSDGIEAQTSVSLSFGDKDHPVEDSRGTAPARPALKRESPGKPALAWGVPDSGSRVVDVGKSEFRLRFSPQTWTGKIGAPAFLSDQKMTSSLPAGAQVGADYCAWRPESANRPDRLLESRPDEDVIYSMEASERSGQTPASIVIEMRTGAGTRIGALRCFFPGAQPAARVDFDRWISIVGGHLTLEFKR